MAAQALQAIKQAEEQASERIRVASAKARDMQSETADRAARDYSAAIADAKVRERAMLDEAKARADAFCDDLVRETEAEIARIRAPEAARFEAVVKLVTERIVNPDGHR